MKPEVIGPKENLVEKAGEILLSSKSLADNIVIFPGKRPAHFLRRYLAEKSGGPLRAPVITSMDGFIDLAAEELGVRGAEAAALDQAGVLFNRFKDVSCRVIARDPGKLTLDSFLPWALKLAGDLEELKIELKTRNDLSGYDDILPEDLRPPAFIRKLESFSRLYDEFYAELEKEGLLTRSMKYARVAEKIGGFDHKRYENIVFAGFFALSGAEKRVLGGLSTRGARILLEPGPGLEEQFAFLRGFPATGGQKTVTGNRSPATGGGAKTELHFHKASDTHGEIFKLAELFASNPPTLQPSNLRSSVIVLPEAKTLFPLIENVLPRTEGYNISMGYPLVSTPVYALLDALGDLLDKKCEAGYFAPDYLKFVFHPYVKNLYLGGAAEPSRVIFQTIEEHLSGRMGKYVRLEEIANDAGLLKEAAGRLGEYGGKRGPADVQAHISAAHKALIVPFENIKDISDFAGKLLALLSHISENSTAPLHPYWAPFAEKAIESVLGMRKSRLAGESFSSPAGYFKFLKASMRGAAYPFPGAPLKGLQVLGLLETRGLKFDRVYFLDANADILPSSRKEDTILSHFVREGLGLSTYKTRERLARYYFTVLLSGAKEAHIFYKDSAAKERSPFVEELIWNLEKDGRRPDESDVHFRARFSQADPGPAAKAPGILDALKNRGFSPSALDTYLNCGLQFYYKYALRLREKDEVSGEMEQRDIGTMVHEILENFFRPRAGRPLAITEADYKSILGEAGKVFDVRLKGHNAGVEYLVKRQIERRLRDILDYHRDCLAGTTVLACETELSAELPTKYGTVKLAGRADRVDRRGGVVHILDYKTGARAGVPNWRKFDLGLREDWRKTLKSTQLPFYIMAYLGENPGTGITGMDASLMLLGQEKIVEETLFKERYKKAAPKAAVFGLYKQAIIALIEEILDPGLPFAPAADEAACADCPFKTLCGRQWVE